MSLLRPGSLRDLGAFVATGYSSSQLTKLAMTRDKGLTLEDFAEAAVWVSWPPSGSARADRDRDPHEVPLQHFRNLAAHAPKVAWTTSRSDALDMLPLASMVHCRLDRASARQWVP